MHNIPENSQTIEYDRLGRMRYNSFYHPNQGTRFTEGGEILQVFGKRQNKKSFSCARKNRNESC